MDDTTTRARDMIAEVLGGLATDTVISFPVTLTRQPDGSILVPEMRAAVLAIGVLASIHIGDTHDRAAALLDLGATASALLDTATFDDV